MKRCRPHLMHVNPHAILVGYSGKIGWDDRLLPLRMTRKYKTFLKKEESNRKEKILEMSQLIEKYQNLSFIINNLRKENKNNENSIFLLELQGEKTKCKKRLLVLKSKLEHLPDILNTSMQEIFDRDTNHSKNRSLPQRKKTSCVSKERVLTRQNCKEYLSNSLPKKTNNDNFQIGRKSTTTTNRTSSMFGSVKSQILIKDHFSNLYKINIDLFSNGENLLHVLATELGEEVLKNCDVTFGTKKVEKKKSLYEQKIYHGSVVNLSLKLHGGGKSKKKKQKNKENTISAKKDNPAESWTKDEVKIWFDSVCKDLDIDEKIVSQFTLMNGKGLNMLQKEDWLSQFPAHVGGLLFRLWNDLKNEANVNDQNIGTDTKKETKSDNLEEKRTSVAALEEKAPISKESGNVPAEVVNDSLTRGPFGKVDNCSDIGDSTSLYNLVTAGDAALPKSGAIISVSGICRKKPRRVGAVVTFPLGDDPPGAACPLNQEDQVKVEVGAKSENQDLNPETVEDLLMKINLGTPVAVRGRVEKLDVMSRFKLVVDTDYHGLVYKENNTAGALTRQLSQPWYMEIGIYPCVLDGKSLDVGDVIEKTTKRFFCNSVTDDDKIKQIAVAFKNSSGGDIFVGVEANGKVTGKEFTQDKAAQWREKISTIIGQMPPEINQQILICTSENDARENLGNKSFVTLMKLGDSTDKRLETISVISRIHITKGTARIYFAKPSDVHVYVRRAAQAMLLQDYEELFSRLVSLRSRKIQPILDIEQQYKQAIEKMNGTSKYKVLQRAKCETQEREFKMIFGDKPVEKIEKDYLRKYTCAFLNSLGGTIFFGVQEDVQSKVGHVVGVVIHPEERKDLVKKLITVIDAFYPPVSTSQVKITFYNVNVSPELLVKYPNTSADKRGQCVLLQGDADEIGNKWAKFVKDKKLLKDMLCRVIKVKPECFAIVVEKWNVTLEQFMKIIKEFEKQNPRVKLDGMMEKDLKPILKNVCVVELLINRSHYPIHMTKPIETSVIDEYGELISPLSLDKLMCRFELDSSSLFDVEKFLSHVENFEPAGNSYLLITSPFNLPKDERDLFGLVIPEWTLTIDFDQELQQEGHLYQIFEDLNDLHKTDRNRFVRTVLDRKLDLNPDNGVCWLAARGYNEIAASLSGESHGDWNVSHRAELKTLLELELASCVKPNQLNIIVLWDENHRKTIYSLHVILEDLISIIGKRTTVTFVCSTPEAKADISDNLVKSLQENYWDIIQEDRVYKAPPNVLAQHLSCKLPAAHRSEDDYQVPHKIYCRGNTHQILPATLRQRLRQNIKGHLKMMYMTRARKAVETELNKERKQFYSGSEITEMGLRGKIGIKRSKMVDLEKVFKNLSSDKKAHVSLILVKADRGAGTSTMCLQFLFEHHKEYPCAQLIEIKDDLVNYIEDINKATKLPLVLLVDEEIAHLQEFLELKKEIERARSANVIILLIEPAEVFCRKQPPNSPSKPNNPRIKSARDNSLYGTSPHKVVELRRDLDEKEVEELMTELIAIDEKKKGKLEKLKTKNTLRTFAHFSLTAFGNKFSGLKNYVNFRLKLADKKQKRLLAFLALTHVFTDSLLPASALAGFLEKRQVVLEAELGNSYLQELLNPRLNENDCRRISFHEVAEEILQQLSADAPDTNANGYANKKYWAFIKQVSVEMAEKVLSGNIGTKKIDRLSRKLFVTSEYESEKFSLLIRSMKEDGGKDTARDTLTELVKVFQKHRSFRAHLLAHLAKYYMNVYKQFDEAKPLIEEAIKDQKDDVLLHHIHGDIIRLHVQVLKDRKKVDMDAIVSCAIESSNCFEIVRNKRPHMSHGYVSDAMVRITVMQAAIKKMGEKDATFVDYLIRMIDNLKERKKEISSSERYLLSLIPDSHQYLEDSTVGFEHKEKWKQDFIECIGELSNLETLYEKLKGEKECFSVCSTWLYEISVQTQVLYNVLEIETENLSPEELEKKIKGIEDCGSRSKSSELTMRFWIRYSRRKMSVPPLEDVSRRINQWVAKTKKTGGISPHAEFYNYVVKVLIALKDPKDRQKMSDAAKLIQRQGRNFKRKKDEVVLPLEWLHCTEKRHINSIDSLLHNDDLIKTTTTSSTGRGKKKKGRELIEGSLFEEQITRWSGTVKDVKDEWQGTIVFKNYLEVRFVPCSVQPSMPSTGDGMRFHLAFDKNGLSAWSVVREFECNQPKGLSELASSDEDTSSDEDKEDSKNEIVVPPSLFSSDIPNEKREIWEEYNGERMQGVVTSTIPDKGFGFLKHPNVKNELFFHASQLVKPVKSLEGTISKYMTLEFTVETLPEKTRAANIDVVEDKDVSPAFEEFLARLHEEQHSTASSSRRENERRENKPSIPVERREEGVILKWREDKDYGFIKSDNSSLRDIFFHRKNLVKKGIEFRIGDRVLFRLSETKKGLEASDIFVQSQCSSKTKWDHFVDRGIQEGFVKSTTDHGGVIGKITVGGGKDNLPFAYKDILNANQFPVVDDAKVHFEVKKRGGRSIAVKINIISVPQPMLHHEMGILGANQAGRLSHFPSTFPYNQPLYFSSLYFENHPDDGDRMDEDP